MRGLVPVPFPVPRAGWRTDQPPHEIPLDALQDGLNVIVDQDGLLKPRLGYDLFRTQPDPMRDVDGRIVQGIGWQEQSTRQAVISTLTRWYALSGRTWLDITGGHLLSGQAVTPVRFAQFGVDPVTGRSVLYGVNGAANDLMHRWIAGQPQYEPVTPQAPAGVTIPISAFAATDIAVIANRLVAVGTRESGIDFPVRVRWSAVNDGTTWHPLAFVDLQGAGNFIAIQYTSRISAVIYCERGAWSMSAVQGGDQNAFVFDRIENVVVGPWNANSVNNVGGIHYFLGTQREIWQCDGQSAVAVSPPIDAGLKQIATNVDEQKPVAFYDVDRRRLLWFVAFEGDTVQEQGTVVAQLEAKHAISFNLFTSSWEAPFAFAHAITAAFEITESVGLTWDDWLVYPAWDDPTFLATFPTWDSVPRGERQQVLVATFGTVPVFPTWDDWLVYPAWDDPTFLADNPSWEQIAAIGERQSGILCRWFAAPTDNGESITYSAVWGLRQPPDASERYATNLGSVYFVPQPNNEAVTYSVDGLVTPYDPQPRQLVQQELTVIAPTTPSGWLVKLPRTIGEGAFRPIAHLRLSLAGVTQHQAMWYAGSVLYADREKRPDFVTGVTGLP